MTEKIHKLREFDGYGGRGNPIRQLQCSCGFSYSAIDPNSEEVDITNAIEEHKLEAILKALGISFIQGWES